MFHTKRLTDILRSTWQVTPTTFSRVNLHRRLLRDLSDCVPVRRSRRTARVRPDTLGCPVRAHSPYWMVGRIVEADPAATHSDSATEFGSDTGGIARPLG
jgi:hypothetical protein